MSMVTTTVRRSLWHHSIGDARSLAAALWHRRQISINIWMQAAAELLLLLIDWTDRQTDGHRYIDAHC